MLPEWSNIRDVNGSNYSLFLLVWFGSGLVGFDTKYEFSDSNPSWVRNEFLFWLPRRPFPAKYTYYLVASHAQNLCIPQVVDSESRRAFPLWAKSRSLWWNRDGAEEEKKSAEEEKNSRRRRGGLFELEARERELEEKRKMRDDSFYCWKGLFEGEDFVFPS